MLSEILRQILKRFHLGIITSQELGWLTHKALTEAQEESLNNEDVKNIITEMRLEGCAALVYEDAAASAKNRETAACLLTTANQFRHAS